jgi:hypothetical protein
VYIGDTHTHAYGGSGEGTTFLLETSTGIGLLSYFLKPRQQKGN